MNITQTISALAKQQPRAPAISLGREGMTYATLDKLIAQLAGLIAKQGVSPGDLVGIGMATTPLHLLTILALAHLGAVSISFGLPPGQPEAVTRDLARRYGVKVVISDRAEFAVEGVARLLIGRGWQHATGGASAPPVNVAEDAPWRIALSSGTTGTQKGMLYSHGQMIEFARLWEKGTPSAGSGTRGLCFWALETSFSLRPCLRHLLCGGAVVFARSTQPRALLDALRYIKVTHAVMSPSLLQTVCGLLDDGGPHFPDLVHLAVGGVSPPPALIRLAKARITPHIYSHYGASEGGLIALADPALLRERPDAAGRLMPWLEAQAVDETGKALAAGKPGSLRFRGPGIISEYLRDPEATARAFRGGWFHPGDTGRIGKDGLLFIEGRSDDRLNLGGEKIDPVEIERVLEQYPEIVEAAVFVTRDARTEVLCAAVVSRSRLQAGRLIEHCRARLGTARRIPEKFVRLRKLPRNSAGKLLRRELRYPPGR